MTKPKDLIYTPNEIVTLGNSYIDDKRKNKDGLIIGLPSIDKDFLPVPKGELVSIIARPGNGKTGFMMRWARYQAKKLEERKSSKIVAYVTWEQSIEELYAFNIAADTKLSVTNMARGDVSDSDWDKLMKQSTQRMTLPLWFIGHSMSRRRKRPNLTISNLALALSEIENWQDNEKQEVDCIFIDYLQRIKIEGGQESKSISISDNLDRLKDAAIAFGCPVIVGVQAVRDVDKRDEQIPTLDDGQWTSNIEQTSDRVISLVRPRKYRKDEEEFGGVLVRGYNQMLVTILKQKLGKDNWARWVSFEPEYNRLDDAEIKYVGADE